MKLEQVDPLFIYFHFFGLRKNLSIFPTQSSCSIGINRNTLSFRSFTENHLF
ncbi:hypothetical protein Hanom_Chr00s013678g01751191 [Helianthus anomalus]